MIEVDTTDAIIVVDRHHIADLLTEKAIGERGTTPPHKEETSLLQLEGEISLRPPSEEETLGRDPLKIGTRTLDHPPLEFSTGSEAPL
jgi:hypothetical protein